MKGTNTGGATMADLIRANKELADLNFALAARLAESEAALLDKIAEQGARLTEAERIIRATECWCTYIGDGEVIECHRCAWLTDSAVAAQNDALVARIGELVKDVELDARGSCWFCGSDPMECPRASGECRASEAVPVATDQPPVEPSGAF